MYYPRAIGLAPFRLALFSIFSVASCGASAFFLSNGSASVELSLQLHSTKRQLLTKLYYWEFSSLTCVRQARQLNRFGLLLRALLALELVLLLHILLWLISCHDFFDASGFALLVPPMIASV